MKLRAGALAAGLGCLAVLQAVHGADRPVDPALLEFLGSVDTEDKDWHDYLAHTDIDQVARRAGNARPQPPVAASPPPKNPSSSGPGSPPAGTTPPSSPPVAHP